MEVKIWFYINCLLENYETQARKTGLPNRNDMTGMFPQKAFGSEDCFRVLLQMVFKLLLIFHKSPMKYVLYI